MESHVEGEKEAGGPLYRGEKEEKGRDYYNHIALLHTEFFL